MTARRALALFAVLIAVGAAFGSLGAVFGAASHATAVDAHLVRENATAIGYRSAYRRAYADAHRRGVRAGRRRGTLAGRAAGLRHRAEAQRLQAGYDGALVQATRAASCSPPSYYVHGVCQGPTRPN
jgi:hypothetical protein